MANQPHGQSAAGTLSKNATFAQIANWIDVQAPGQGAAFIAWVQANNTVPPPYAFHLHASTFGPPPNNKATNWLGAWILLGNVGPNLGGIIKAAYSRAGQSIPGQLKAVGSATGSTLTPVTNPLAAIDGLLTNSNMWTRAIEIGLGLLLIAVGVARMTDRIPVATAIARKVS